MDIFGQYRAIACQIILYDIKNRLSLENYRYCLYIFDILTNSLARGRLLAAIRHIKS